MCNRDLEIGLQQKLRFIVISEQFNSLIQVAMNDAQDKRANNEMLKTFLVEMCLSTEHAGIFQCRLDEKTQISGHPLKSQQSLIGRFHFNLFHLIEKLVQLTVKQGRDGIFSEVSALVYCAEIPGSNPAAEP
ncbi:uncharacterized protein isoform X1 [Rhodnius prolixus]|uniref:uncharacterized protein isoform X1 n=1 Tax=Rhodnius prolixus TaxID=13249 RepID=UPI003D18CF6B